MNYVTADISGKTTDALQPSAHFAPLEEDDGLETRIDTLTVTMARFEPVAIPHATNDIREESLSFPAIPGLIYTARLRALLPVFISQLFAMFSEDRVVRGAASRLRDIRAVLRGLYTAEKENYVKSMTAAIQANPVWQAQVREDLGGEPALARWEARQQTLLERERSEPQNPIIEAFLLSAVSAPKDTAKPKTDRTGLFRLAPYISQEREIGPRTHHAQTRGRRSAATSFQITCPIGLTPGQLRPRPESESIAQTLATALSVLSYDALWERWCEMQMEHHEWRNLLTLAGLMTTSRALRCEFAPP